MTEERIKDLELIAQGLHASRIDAIEPSNLRARGTLLALGTLELIRDFRETKQELEMRDCEVNGLKECLDSVSNAVAMVGFSR